MERDENHAEVYEMPSGALHVMCDGEWCGHVRKRFEANDRAAAERYALDHNQQVHR